MSHQVDDPKFNSRKKSSGAAWTPSTGTFSSTSSRQLSHKAMSNKTVWMTVPPSASSGISSLSPATVSTSRNIPATHTGSSQHASAPNTTSAISSYPLLSKATECLFWVFDRPIESLAEEQAKPLFKSYDQ